MLKQPFKLHFWPCLFALLNLLAGAGPAGAQVVEGNGPGYMAPRPLAGPGAASLGPRTYPKGQYYYPFAAYYDGQFEQALEEFQDAVRGTRKVPGPWLDAIPHYAMLGECYYQLGRMGEALDQFTTALQITAAYPDWLNRVQFAPAIRPVGAGRYVNTPWGQTRRQPTLGYFPDATVYFEGQVDNAQPVQQGGVVRAPQYLSLNVYEIVRGTCLALRRRTELLGALGESDPLNQQLVAQFLQASRADWTRCLTDVPLGLAYRAAGKPPQAQAVLERTITVDEFDHPFTALVLLELGQLAANSGNAPAAARYLEEATYAAAQYEDADTIEAAVHELLGMERVLNGQHDLPRLRPAADWAGARELRKLRVMLLLAAAEQLATAGETDAAAQYVQQADQLVGRRDTRTSRGGARLHWMQAFVAYQQGDLETGDATLAQAISFGQRGLPRQFQLQSLGRLIGNEQISARNALAIYASLLRGPVAADWLRDPFDALTASATPQQAAFEQWFLLAWDRQRAEELASLFEIAELSRRHHFLSSLKLGGRPQVLANLLSTPPAQLPGELRLQRQELLGRYPELNQLQQAAEPLHAEFVHLAAAKEVELRRSHGEVLERLAALVGDRQRALRELTVRREPAGITFPPIRSSGDVQKTLPPKHAVVAFYTAQQRTFGFFVSNDKYQVWEIAPAEKIRGDVAALLKAWGHTSSHRPLSAAELVDKKWKTKAAALVPLLFGGAQTDFPSSLPLDEITVVPDGALWYLPFEALEIGASGKTRPLIAELRVRYAPMASLAVDRVKPVAPREQTTVILGKVAQRDDEATLSATMANFTKAAPGAVGWRRPISDVAALAATVSGRLIVLDTLPLDGKSPLSWSPLGLNRDDTETTIADWLALPWHAPREVLLPGFHTIAEAALKSEEYSADGNELFLASMGLLSAGARTVVLNRWRTGGATTQQEILEFVQELPFTSPADAWQRSLLLCMRNPLNPAEERRLKWKDRQSPPLGAHPFFWAGPLLIDCGIAPDTAEEDQPQVARDPAD